MKNFDSKVTNNILNDHLHQPLEKKGNYLMN